MSSDVPAYDAILIPGGGVASDGQPNPWVIKRLDRAAELYKTLDNVLLMPLSAGTIYKPPVLDAAGFPVYESVAAGRYLVEQHSVLPEAIRPESLSLDTIGNAAYARWLLTDPDPAVRKLLVITSEFHMPRTKKIFEWIYGLSPTVGNYQLDFEAVANVGLSNEELAARVAKETQSLQSVALLAQKITTTNALLTWLYTEHAAYDMSSNLTPRPTLDPTLLSSY